eukprot:augustus_masked-scaffold_25-processed-gene-5.44-mRNA-1 protein AED:0.03 eAED:0.03 QI:0/-1/0/1/-1/1/1/0/322
MKVNVKAIADTFKTDLRLKITEFKTKHNLNPTLVGFLANNDSGAKQYALWTQRSCVADGIDFQLRTTTPLELEENIKQANQDANVHGIIIYYPCFGSHPSFFGGTMDDYLRDLVAPEKDVEGLCYTYRHNLYHNIRFLKTLDGIDTNKKCLLPCTPLAIVKTLDNLGLYTPNLKGKVVTIINRSDIVGRPLSAMLANDKAEVYSVDIDSIFVLREGKMLKTEKTVEEAVKCSDIVITGVPSKEFNLDCSKGKVKEGCVFVNVSQFKNFDEAQVKETKGVRVVGQIGKVTVSMLERNLLRLVEQFHIEPRSKLVEAGGRIVHK